MMGADDAGGGNPGVRPEDYAGLSVAVIGHRGRMGAMFSRRWHEAGIVVRGVDQGPRTEKEDTVTRGAEAPHAVDPYLCEQGQANPEQGGAERNGISAEDMREAVQGAAIVLLAVPAAVLPSLLNQLTPMLSERQILADIISVKMHPLRQMERRYAGPVVGTHPLFGPDPLPEDMLTAVVPGKNAEEQDILLVEGLFALMGSRTFRTTAQEHDRGAAYVQGLNFISSAAYLASLSERQDIMPFLTPSFRRRLESARKLLTEDAPMFQGFTSANPMTPDAIHTFRLFLDLVEGGGLPDVVRRARWWYEK